MSVTLLRGEWVACAAVETTESCRIRPDFQEHRANFMLGFTDFFLLKKRS